MKNKSKEDEEERSPGLNLHNTSSLDKFFKFQEVCLYGLDLLFSRQTSFFFHLAYYFIGNSISSFPKMPNENSMRSEFHSNNRDLIPEHVEREIE